MRGVRGRSIVSGDCALVGTRPIGRVIQRGVSWLVARTKWDLAFAILLGIVRKCVPGVSVGLAGGNLAVHLRLSAAGG